MKHITVRELLEKLNESPLLNDEERTLRELSSIQYKNVLLLNSPVGTLPISGFEIFKNHKHGGYIVGKNLNGEFHIVMRLNQRDVPYPVVPKQINNYFQVSNVDVDKRHVEQGIAKETYTFIAQHSDIVSDHEQFLGALYLWKSLAKSNDVNVYVFNGKENDYIRNGDGSIKKYNGKNIEEHMIWGNSETYRTVLLVATTKELK